MEKTIKDKPMFRNIIKYTVAVTVLLTGAITSNAQLLTEMNEKVIKDVCLETEIVVCGGGLSGVCTAVAAARHGSKVILIQDRPMLGGNTSSEMRMGIVGVREDQCQEAGIIEEMQCRNFRYNPLQRYTLWDDIIYSTVIEEPNIKLLLNTTIEDVVMDGANIAAVKCWNINAYTRYKISGKLFVDCTGDGILRLSGAKYRRGSEDKYEFNETFVTNEKANANTMGNSILLQLRRCEEHRSFKAPDWAYHFTDEDFAEMRKFEDVKKYPQFADLGETKASSFRVKDINGRDSLKLNYKIINTPVDNNFWWIECSGIDFDTIFDANEAQFELKKIAYGIWEYMKNNVEECKTYELDWMGSLPGKRESTRYIAPHILTQDDVTSGGHFEDVVAYGGWTLDNHDSRGFHSKGLASVEHFVGQGYGIPYDCLYSVNVPNLMFAGRDISASHMAFSATRVMATCALIGQAVGTAADMIIKYDTTPAGIRKDYIAELQDKLEQDDCMLPYRWRKVGDLTLSAKTAVENEPMRNGIDREWEGEDNGVYTVPGETNLSYTWKKPVTISGARFIFDSDFKVRGKRMRKLEATPEYCKMPSEMAQDFHVEVLVGKEWVKVAEVNDNWRRLSRVSFEPVQAKGIRLVVDSTWGAEKAHVFAFDVL